MLSTSFIYLYLQKEALNSVGKQDLILRMKVREESITSAYYAIVRSGERNVRRDKSPLHSLQSPPVGLLFRLGLGLGGGLLLGATEHAEESSAASLLEVGIVGTATGALHVGQIFRVLDRARVDGEQVLATALLPFGEGARLEGGDANLAEIFPLVRRLFFVLDLLPLLLRHTAGDVFVQGGRGGLG